LDEVGVVVGHDKLLDALAGLGARIDKARQRATFPKAVVEAFLSSCPKVDWETRVPSLITRASFYWGKYEDPDTGELGPIDERRVREFFTLGKALPNVRECFMTGCPFAPTPEASPLYERFFCWKYGALPSAVLYPLGMAPRLKALYEAYAALKGKSLPDVFQGGIFMMSPLRLSPEEAAQFVWWWEQGCRVEIAHMTTAGLSAPVTTAGLVTVNIAEQFAIRLLMKACTGETTFNLSAMVAAADMRTMIRPYGRPEMPIANRLIAAMARHYGVPCFVQTGATDAKRPSCEAGAQKAISIVSAFLSGADAMLDAGLLSIDEIFSPIQMILDNELAGALKRFLLPLSTDDDALGFEAIAEVGPGGGYADHPHTAEHFREALWEPSVWSRDMMGTWEKEGRKIDTDRARELYHALMEGAAPIEQLTPEEQKTLLAVIEGK
ncbi:MAG: trimethylamine methyltransferase family protein, partial [Lentisphaerae bacterium]|nr:trimethylamine methyltransferase family protein [Lentisphaerota bacterium]